MLNGLRETLDVSDPVRPRVVFVLDAEALRPLQHDVEPAVRQPLVVRDDARAADVEHGRPAFVVLFEPWTQQHHSDQPVAVERVHDHRAIPRLEDVQRQVDAGEEDDVGKGEEWDLHQCLVPGAWCLSAVPCGLVPVR